MADVLTFGVEILVAGTEPESVMSLRYSDDGGGRWTDRRHLDLGVTGEFCKPVVARRFGNTRQRVWEVSYSGDRRCDLLACSVQIEGEG